jgi:hypothetical protein
MTDLNKDHVLWERYPNPRTWGLMDEELAFHRDQCPGCPIIADLLKQGREKEVLEAK